MMHKHPRFHSLSRKIVIQFCVFTLVISAMYGFISFVLMYMLEDSFIEKELLSEGNFLATQFERSGSWPKARKRNMQLYFSLDSFPEDIRLLAIEEPKRVEYYGEQQRHYHVYAIKGYDSVWLIAEVSDELMVRKVRGGVILFLTVSATVLTLVACFVAWLIGRKTARPLKELAELVDGVAPQQMPDTFAHRFPNNEIGILARTLEDTFQRINRALEREKYFTRDVSHELRTPLAVIKNALELRQSQQGSQGYREGYDKTIDNRVAEAAQQMDNTVSTLLMLAREENTRAHKQQIKLMPLVEQAVLDNGLLLEGKPVDVHIDDSCNSEVQVQPGMLKVLLDNLLSNAFQYTQEGEVSVAFYRGELVVQDTGPGIEDAISEKLTETGVKGVQSTGFGFGLSIVKRLCEHQGWQFKVESGQGAKFGTRVSVLL